MHSDPQPGQSPSYIVHSNPLPVQGLDAAAADATIFAVVTAVTDSHGRRQEHLVFAFPPTTPPEVMLEQFAGHIPLFFATLRDAVTYADAGWTDLLDDEETYTRAAYRRAHQKAVPPPPSLDAALTALWAELHRVRAQSISAPAFGL